MSNGKGETKVKWVNSLELNFLYWCDFFSLNTLKIIILQLCIFFEMLFQIMDIAWFNKIFFQKKRNTVLESHYRDCDMLNCT